MAGIAHVLVVLGVARQGERVMPADRVAHHLHQRAHVLVVELPEQPRLGVGVPHQVAGGGGVQAALGPFGQPGGMEGQEVGALTALDVDDLDVLARLHLVGAGGGGVHPQVEHRFGQRRRKPRLAGLPRRHPPDLDHQVRGRVVLVHAHQPAGSGHHAGQPLLRGELRPRARGRPLPEQRHRAHLPGVEPPRRQRADDRGGFRLRQPVAIGPGWDGSTGWPGRPGPGQRAQDRGRGVGRRPERPVVLPAAREHGELTPLPAFGVGDREHVARVELNGGDGPGLHPVPLYRRVRGQQPGQDQARALRGQRHDQVTCLLAPWPRPRPAARAACPPLA